MTYYEIDHKLSIYADSSEEKPTVYKTMSDKTLPIPGGSVLYLVDTSSIFVWNDLKSRWDQKICGNGSGGSGGGSVDSDIFIVTIDWDEAQQMYVPDHTLDEIRNAYDGGKTIISTTSDKTIFVRGFYDDEDGPPRYYYSVIAEDYELGAYVIQWYTYKTTGITSGNSQIYYGTFNADAQSFDVVEGKVFYNADGHQIGTASPPIQVSPVTFTANGTYTASSGTAYSPVTVNVGEGGGGSGGSETAYPKDVNFRDYDGTIVYSYTASEFAELTAMPADPDHSGDAIPLTSQGWNWLLSDAQSYVAKYGKLEIGHVYKTTDNKTHVLIHLEEGRTSPMLGCCPNGTVTVDWGDGTATDTLEGTSVNTVKWTPTHNYADPGDYNITLTCIGTMGFYGNSATNQYSGLLRFEPFNDARNHVYQNAIRSVKCAETVTSIGNNAFQSCYSLQSITIPDGVKSIGLSAFSGCSSLSSITIPDGITSIDNSMFSGCYSLSSIMIPDGVTSIGTYVFNLCLSLFSIMIPDGVTSIGAYAFQNCYSLASITIPDGVTNIGAYAFNACYSLASITIPDGVKSINNYVFQNCYSLSSITIPNGVTSIGNNAFNSCQSLSSITIPDSVTSIGAYALSGCSSLTNITIPDEVTRIWNYMFQNCYSLSSITIPDSVTSIDNYAFSNCSGITKYHILPTTPPSLTATYAFYAISADCIMYVPKGCLEAYQTATNWSTYASHMQEEP